MWLRAALSLWFALLGSCATIEEMPPMVKSELAPTGTLRIGLNYGNALLVTREQTGGEPTGVVVDISRELGKRIGVPVQFVTYDRPILLAEAANSGEWDVAFLAVEPARATVIDFSPPYAEIEASYLVREDSKLRNIDDVDRAGLQISVSKGTAYDLFLSRYLKAAKLTRTQSLEMSVSALRAEQVDAVAGIREMLMKFADSGSALRVIDGRFTAIQQAIGTPRGHTAAAKYLEVFFGDLKETGFVAKAIERHGVRGLSVAP